MLETEPQNRQPEPNEPGGSRQGQDQEGSRQNQAQEGSQRRGLLRRTRRGVAKPAEPEFRSGEPDAKPGAAQDSGSDGSATGRAASGGSGGQGSGRRASGPVPAVPVVPVVPVAGSSGTGTRHGDQPSGPAQPVPMAAFQAPVVVFQPPDLTERRVPAEASRPRPAEQAEQPDNSAEDSDGSAGGSRRRRRGGRGRGKGGSESGQAGGQDNGSGSAGTAQAGSGNGQGAQGATEASASPDGGTAKSAGADQRRSGQDRPGQADTGKAAANRAGAESADDGASDGDDAGEGSSSSSRRRRRRRQRGGGGEAETAVPAPDDPTDTVVHVREPRPATTESDDVRAVKGSTRLEAKRQRRRESRDTGRRRPPIISESEFLARREAVERVMLVRQQGDRTQIAVLEDDILVEHYVDKASSQSYVGNVYLGKVQNVLPSMEAAFVDIGKGRNAVLYAGEVNFDASGLEGVAKRIESALKSGQSIMVQVTKDPIGHKGARLTSQVSLPGRYLVYVPGASMTGISRKLPDTERSRLKQILKKVAPEEGGIIVRTAAEGASEEELQHDVTRLVAQWQAIERKAKTANAPDLLYGEPDLTIRVVRDIFNEDFTKLVIASDSEWDLVDEYVRYVAPTLSDRMERWSDETDLFAAYRIDEQLAKALDRKVWLPSGGSLVIDTTEAMTVIDVNTGKFTGQGGNLEQTVTRNNLEAAEEIVRQLRLRDVGGIIVIDFIDMVLESNRDLVLRRLIECLARDRTKHQVAEVTSLGLVQMTRKRVGSGLLAAFSVPCEHCSGRGVLVSTDLTELPHAHGRNGQQGSAPKPGLSRSRSARTKAIAQVARTLEPQLAAEDTEVEPREVEEPVAAAVAPRTGSARSANGGSSSGRGSSARSRRSGQAAEPAADGAAAQDSGPDGEAADGEAAITATTGTIATGAQSPNGSSEAGLERVAAGETVGDGGSADQPSAGPAQAASAGPEHAAAPRKRTRRSAYREAGPPDSVLASAAPPAPAAGPAPVAEPAQAISESPAVSAEPAASAAEPVASAGPEASAAEPEAKASEPPAKPEPESVAAEAAIAAPATAVPVPADPEPADPEPADPEQAAPSAETEPGTPDQDSAPEASAPEASIADTGSVEATTATAAPETETPAVEPPARPEDTAVEPAQVDLMAESQSDGDGPTPASEPVGDPADATAAAEQPTEG
jgi:ribonuclease E